MSPLDPQSPAAEEIATLWWWMLAIAGVIFVGTLGLLVLAWWRREERGFPLIGQSERFNTGLVSSSASPILLTIGEQRLMPAVRAAHTAEAIARALGDGHPA